MKGGDTAGFLPRETFLPLKISDIDITANRLKGMFCSSKHDIDLNKDINCLNGYMVINNKLMSSEFYKGIFKNIEDESIDGIMQIYADSKKQIFISFDRASSYNPNISTIVYDNTRLELGIDGHELYGMNWKSNEDNS